MTKQDGMWLLRRAMGKAHEALNDARNEPDGCAARAISRLKKNEFWISQKPSRAVYTVIEGHENDAINSLILAGYIIK